MKRILETPTEHTLDSSDVDINKKEKSSVFPIVATQKISVFISSICGDNGKYDYVRGALKNAIEGTQLAQVYLFEQTGPSSLSAELHFSWKLENSDVCIFLIDNADGVSDGVLKEHEIVKNNNIKALYYFCDETTSEKTALEKSITGAMFAKSTTVHKFDDLSCDGAQGLIDDIINIYINYCSNHFIPRGNNGEEDNIYAEFAGNEKLHALQIPKSVFKNLDKCKRFILKMLGISVRTLKPENINTSELDDWGTQFLEMLFEGKSVKSINCAMFLKALEDLQDNEYHQLVCLRWNAIQEYFVGNIEKCVQNIEESLKLAKEKQQLDWIIKDILIDDRNQRRVLDTINNTCSESVAQKELNESKETFYYPLLDRFYQTLQEKYLGSFFEETIKSPHSITLGDNYDELVTLLASAFIVTIYNGSLTQVLLFYEKVRGFLFYLSCVQDEMKFKKNLLKFTIFENDENKVSAICNSYPETLNSMIADDAADILQFCENQVIEYKKFASQLVAFGTVGYYLSDQVYIDFESIILNKIKEWIEDDQRVFAVGGYIFKNLAGVSHRISQDTLANFCMLFMEKHLSRWYMDMFKFIGNSLDINKMSLENSQSLIRCIVNVLDDEKERELIKYNPEFLCVLRNQNREYTNELDSKILEHLPQFYNDIYKLETTDEQQKDLPILFQKYIDSVEYSNNEQGKGGRYFVRGLREIDILRSLLLDGSFDCPENLIDSTIAAVADTLLVSKESTATKLDAISLLVAVVLKYPKEYEKNCFTFQNIIDKKESIFNIKNTFMDANIDKISLSIGVCFLQIAMGEEVYAELLRCMTYIYNDTATILAVEKIVKEYLEVDEQRLLPQEIDALVLQYILQWTDYNYLDVRWQATIILFQLLRNDRNKEIINQKIMNLINSDGVYIKNLIQRQMQQVSGIEQKTKEYVISKCKCDENFVVRMVCEEHMTVY